MAAAETGDYSTLQQLLPAADPDCFPFVLPGVHLGTGGSDSSSAATPLAATRTQTTEASSGSPSALSGYTTPDPLAPRSLAGMSSPVCWSPSSGAPEDVRVRDQYMSAVVNGSSASLLGLNGASGMQHMQQQMSPPPLPSPSPAPSMDAAAAAMLGMDNVRAPSSPSPPHGPDDSGALALSPRPSGESSLAAAEGPYGPAGDCTAVMRALQAQLMQQQHHHQGGGGPAACLPLLPLYDQHGMPVQQQQDDVASEAAAAAAQQQGLFWPGLGLPPAGPDANGGDVALLGGAQQQYMPYSALYGRAVGGPCALPLAATTAQQQQQQQQLRGSPQQLHHHHHHHHRHLPARHSPTGVGGAAAAAAAGSGLQGGQGLELVDGGVGKRKARSGPKSRSSPFIGVSQVGAKVSPWRLPRPVPTRPVLSRPGGRARRPEPLCRLGDPRVLPPVGCLLPSWGAVGVWREGG